MVILTVGLLAIFQSSTARFHLRILGGVQRLVQPEIR